MNNICVGDIARVTVLGHFSIDICLVFNIIEINNTKYAHVFMKNKTSMYNINSLVKI